MKRIIVTTAALLFALMIPLATSSFGAIITIPDDYSTIQAGIDAAVNGDTVLVRDGTYLLTAALDFKGKAITVESEHGDSSCFLDGQNTTRVVYFHSGEDNNSVLSGFTIRNGYSTQGGGIYLSTSSPTISHCTIKANTVHVPANLTAYGGGIFSDASSPIITDCNIQGNSATADGYGEARGGGIYVNGGSPVITNSIVSGNMAWAGGSGHGGGIASNSSSISITNTDIYNNSAAQGFYDDNGGGLHFSASTPLLVNCTISYNTAETGAGIYFYQSSAFSQLVNCTIARNIASGSGGGLYCDSTSPNIVNSILWQDTPGEVNQQGGTTTITYSDVYGGYPGTGNIDADPAFVNIAMPDFHLTGSSPCINAGSNAAPYLPLLDKDGKARINGSSVDMGAYEYQYQPLAAELSVFRPDEGTWYTLFSSSPLVYSSEHWGVSTDVTIPGDYDGDGKMDYAVWRPSTGMWYVLPSATPGSYTETHWGVSTDNPVPGDYDLDGKTDIAVWRPGNGVWYVLPSGSQGTYIAVQWGANGDVPIPPFMGIKWPLP